MTSIIREPTDREKGLAIRLAEGTEGPEAILLDQAESKGFRAIEYSIGEKRLLILTSNGKVLEWDRDPRSLDELREEMPQQELKDASVYLGLISQVLYGQQ